MPKALFVFAVLVGSLPICANAQFASISGRVFSAESDTIISNANVELRGPAGTRGTATDANGRFAFTNVPPGTYVLSATFVGYAARRDTLEIAFGQDIRLDIRLQPQAGELNEVLIAAEQPPVSSEGAAHIRVDPAALQGVPMPDVSLDLAAYLMTRPGIISPGDRGGQLFIRGGTPAQNLVLLDGMHIYRPFHIVGFYSIFPADIVAQADIYAGGFGAEYGGRISSVIDVTARNGNKRHVDGAASIAPFMASVRAEIPFIPERVSLLASVRESVIERVAPDLIGQALPYRFGDRFLKLHAYLNRTSSFAATVLHSFDEGDIAAIEGDPRPSTWINTAAGARYFYLPEDYPATAEIAFFGTRYESTFQPSVGEMRRSDIETFDFQLRFAYLLDALQIGFGLEGMTNWLTYDLGEDFPREDQNFTEGGFHGSVSWDGEHFDIEPGLRLQLYSGGVGTTFEPRLRASWAPGGANASHVFSGAWGIYHQQFIGLNNFSDITDAFTAWSAAPAHQPLPRSVHVIAGWRSRLANLLTMNLEAYRRSVQNVLFPPDPAESTARPSGSPRFATDCFANLCRVDGLARGLDWTLALHRPGLRVQIGYGLALVSYTWPDGPDPDPTGPQPDPTGPGPNPTGPEADPTGLEPSHESRSHTFSPPHDRRHSLSIGAQLSRGPYRLNFLWQFGSGIPFTPIDGYFVAAPPASPEDRTFLTDEGTVHTVFGEAYSRRLPAFHRLDISAERDFRFADWRLVLHAGLVNAYNRANIFSYDVISGRRVDQLPLIPSAGIRVEIDA